MRKIFAACAAALVLSLSFTIICPAAEMNYDIFPDWGISIASPDYTDAVYRTDQGNYYIYTMETGAIPYVMVKPYEGFGSEEDFVNSFFLEYMYDRYDDLQITSDLTLMEIGGKSCYEIEFDYTIEGGYHVLDRRIFKTVGDITYMFCSKEVGELEMTLGTVLEDVFAASVFLEEPVEVNPEPETKTEPKDPDKEIFLVVTSYYHNDESPDPEPNVSDYAFVAKAGEDLQLHGGDSLVITITSIDSDGVSFTTKDTNSFSAGGYDDATDSFTIPQGETLRISNVRVAGYESAYELSVADASITLMEDPHSFAWDIDGDGQEEQITVSCTDNGDTYQSYNYFTITEEDGSAWDAYLDHSNEIISVRIVKGPGENFLILETGSDSYGEGETSYVVLYGGDQELTFLN